VSDEFAGWPDVLATLSRREALTAAQAEATMRVVFAGEATARIDP